MLTSVELLVLCCCVSSPGHLTSLCGLLLHPYSGDYPSFLSQP